MTDKSGFVPIDFASLAAALLDRADTLVKQWLPDGTERNGRWYVGDFDGGAGESANVNLDTGTWIDNGGGPDDRGGDLLSLYRRINGYHTMTDAALAVMDELGWRRHNDSRQQTSQAVRPASDLADEDGVLLDVGAGPREPDLPAQTSAPVGSPDKPRERTGRWRSVLPVPKHAPTPKRFIFGFKNEVKGAWEEIEATAVWPYEFEGERFGWTARFDRIDSKGVPKKDVLQLTWCEDTRDERGGHKWNWKHWPAPRPLYVPNGFLSGTPADVPVVLVEGEKKCHAGMVLLGHEFDFVSWPGGCKAWALARWSWLMGRTVYLWPDCDAQRYPLSRQEKLDGVDPTTKDLLPEPKQPGMAAMVGIGQLLQAEFGCTVFMVPIPKPGEKAGGWDLADAIAEGWDAARVREFIRSARAFVGPNEAQRAAAGTGTVGISTPSKATAEGAKGGAQADERRDWVTYLMCTEKGGTRPVRENIILALDGRPDRGVPGIEACAGLVGFNEFSNNIEKLRPTPWGTDAGDWLEADELMMGDWLVREHYMPSMPRTLLVEAVQVVASRHRFHPLRERMVALRGRWDKQDRLDTWLRRVFLEEDEYDDKEPLQQYLQRAGKWFLMGMVARLLPRVMEGKMLRVGAGTKFDYMLVFESPQGWGKSTVAKMLVGEEYFADTGLDINNKDSLMNIQGIGVYEWSELENLNRQEVGAVKRFISSSSDRFRATFDKRPAKYPRQVVFVGTTNEAHYLTDPTGNRRFWPIRLTRPPDMKWLQENLEQLLAEAVHRVDLLERFWPTREEQRDLFDPQQSARSLESSLESSILTFLYDEDQKVPHGSANGALVSRITMVDLLSRVGYSAEKQTDAVVKKAGALMHKLGWEVWKAGKDETGYRPRYYMRPKKVPTLVPGASFASNAEQATAPSAASTEGDDDAPPF